MTTFVKKKLKDKEGNYLVTPSSADIVYCSDGETVATKLRKVENDEFSPTITQVNSMAKVGEGTDVDVSANAQEGYVKSAILSGQTLVNLQPKGNSWSGNTGVMWYNESIPNSLFKPNTKYFLKFNSDLSNILESCYLAACRPPHAHKIYPSVSGCYAIMTTNEAPDGGLLHVYPKSGIELNSTILNENVRFIFTEYQEGMENWDIPYFEGMQSVKMPVLKTTGKNLFDMKRVCEELNKIKPIIIIENNTLIIESSDIYNHRYKYRPINFKSNMQYTLSANIESNSSSIGMVLGFQYTDGTFNYISIKRPKLTSDANKTIEYITFSYGVLGVVETWSNIQLEEASSVTNYEPHKSNILSVPIENHKGFNGVYDTVDCITGEVVERIEEITFDGSQDERWSFVEMKGDNYRFSLSLTKPCKGSGDLTALICDKFKVGKVWQEPQQEQVIIYNHATYYELRLMLSPQSITSNSVDELRSILQSNPFTIQYEVAEPVVKTVDLSNQKVYSYDGTTHYTCSSEDGSLIPTLSIDVPTNLPALVSRQRNTIQELEKENEVLKEEVVAVDHQRENGDVELLGYNFDLDFRLLEIECALDLPMTLSARSTKGANDMNTYKTAKTLILAGNYEREDMEYKLSVYLKRGRLTQDEYDELIALMDARELVE